MSEDGRDVGERADDAVVTDDESAKPRARGGAASKARGAKRHFAAGYAAVRDVRKASRQRSAAKSEARTMRAELAADEKALARRLELEGGFDGIVAEQTQLLQAARADERSSQDEAERLDSECATLEAQLSALKLQHEEELRPYRKLADAAKGRADDAAVALAEARRAVKSADGRMAEAVRDRDQRVQAANRALDSAQSRLHRAQSELERLQTDEEAPASLVERMRGEVAAESTAILAAKGDVGQAADETQLAVETAQTHLWTQRQSLEVAQRQSDAAKHEARVRREEYDALYRSAKEQEDEIAAWIRSRKRGMEKARASTKEAHGRVEAARALLDEAYEVHATPEATEGLREKVAMAQEELGRRGEELDHLARREQMLRKRTRSLRFAFVAAIVFGVLAIALLVWVFAFGKR